MERRFVLFVILSFGILLGHFALTAWLNPPEPEPPKPGPAKPQMAAEKVPKLPKVPEKEEPEKPFEAPDDEVPRLDVPADQPAIPRRFITLGSIDPADPYRMLVTLTNKGAAVERIELSSPKYLDIDDRSGYLGFLVIDEALIDDSHGRKCCPVQVVGPGTPAAKAGLKPGDRIVAIGKRCITSVRHFRATIKKTKPNHKVELTVLRGDKKLKLTTTLRRRPLQLIHPEGDDPLSFLLTLDRYDDQTLEDRRKRDLQIDENAKPEDVNLFVELDGLDLRTGNWDVVESDATKAVFRKILPRRQLEITKTYRLATVPEKEIGNRRFKAYHLLLDVTIRNVGRKSHEVAYQLDGPTGLPDEGAWYANKSSRTWSAAGLRDVIVSFDYMTPSLVTCTNIANGKVDKPWQDQSLTFIGVDAQYFSVVMIPEKEEPTDIWFAQSQPLRVGPVDEKMPKITDTSCRVVSNPSELAPGEKLSHRYTIFAGPKSPELLADYDLGELVYYGWFSWLAVPMVHILHVFYSVVHNYALAVLMLTVLVRGCMYPLSRRQVLGAIKMQQLQPEIKKLQEKYKTDMEGRTKAQQDLFRKHNYNPLSGCLVLFVQLPIFIALYRSLMVDIELRQAPLISQSVRWCSNLAAPDMLYDWSGLMPEFVNSGVGFFGLGPYFNLLPILTIVLFIAQQKMFMPPPTDEQSAMQQKMMKYMMVFMGLIFFKVASGLCIYFIASSLWGLAERQFMPKHTPATSADTPESRATAKSKARADAAAEAKRRGKD